MYTYKIRMLIIPFDFVDLLNIISVPLKSGQVKY